MLSGFKTSISLKLKNGKVLYFILEYACVQAKCKAMNHFLPQETPK